MESNILYEVFEKWWPTLEEHINGILTSQKKILVEDQRSEIDFLKEILETVRAIAKYKKPAEVGHLTAHGIKSSDVLDPERINIAVEELVRVSEAVAARKAYEPFAKKDEEN